MTHRLSIILYTVFIALTVSTAATAQVRSPITAVQLQALCDSKYDIDFGICAGYVSAVAERLMGENDPSRRVCLSPAISPQTLVANLVKAWDVAPPSQQDFAAESVESALRQRFQCP